MKLVFTQMTTVFLTVLFLVLRFQPLALLELA
jgi:hypothetical protein